jgi:hypothetical protein
MKRLLFAVWGMLCASTGVYGQTDMPHLLMRSTFVLRADEVGGLKISELSGLAWDEDEQLLYAVSDKGRLFHLRLVLEGNQIRAVEPVRGMPLLNTAGDPLKKARGDAEGLAVINANNGRRGDTQLVISLEGDPRIVRFTPDGRAISNIVLPAALRERKAYWHPNSSLESVTFHLRYGFITAPEMPLKGQPRNLHTLYSTKGQQWSFMAYPAENSGISALETLPNGNLLILERAWSGILNPLVVSLRYLDFRQCSREGACQAQDLQVSSSRIFIDNFEGLTHIKGNQYLMVSDDGDEDLLNTTFVLFTLDLAE